MLHFWVEEKLNVCLKLQCPVLSNTVSQYFLYKHMPEDSSKIK